MLKFTNALQMRNPTNRQSLRFGVESDKCRGKFVEIMENRNVSLLAAIAFLIVVVGTAFDLHADNPDSWFSVHVIAELGIMFLSLGLAVYLWTAWKETSNWLEITRKQLDAESEQLKSWRSRAEDSIRAFSASIDDQFLSWELTPTERQVALHILKGHSLKEIAVLFERSERTVRQHASAVYTKSGLSGRAELAGFFLGNLYITRTGKRDN